MDQVEQAGVQRRVIVRTMDRDEQELIATVAMAEGAEIARWSPWGITFEGSAELARKILLEAGRLATAFKALRTQMLVEVLGANGYAPSAALECQAEGAARADDAGDIWEWEIDGLAAAEPCPTGKVGR